VEKVEITDLKLGVKRGQNNNTKVVGENHYSLPASGIKAQQFDE